MFKKLILAVLIMLPMTALAQKFGTVEIEEVFSQMEETKAMQTELQNASKQYEDAFQKLTEELDKMFKEYQTIANDATVLDAIKERHIQNIQERQQNAEKFRQTAQEDLARKQQTLSAPIIQKLNQAITSVGQEGGFTMIFPKNPDLTLYCGADVIDVTPQVKAKLGIK